MEQIELNTVINLEQSTYAHRFSEEELIHKKEYERVMKLIDRQLDMARAIDTTLYPQTHYYNTIAVFGERGTGKTSFLHSVLATVKEQQEDVEILGIIDPTLIEEKEHIFLLVVSMINERVIRKLSDSECMLETEAYEQRHQWEAKLKRLAKGLPTLEKLGTDHRNMQWQSQDFIMERGLSNVYAAFTLEENFHKVVDCALQILNKKAFLLALDDIDVDMKKGWDVLEMLRKYITTPQILTLLSGNLKLYSLNVRKHQWGQLTVNKEHDEKKDYTKIVNELEGQYLLKVLKSENRIHLHTILESMQIYSLDYDIEQYAEEKMGITDVYKDILHNLGIKGDVQRTTFQNYLLGLSIRSQIQFMLNNRNEQKQGLESVEAFLSRLYAANVDVELAVNNVMMLNLVIQRYIEEQESTPELYLLTPSYANEDVNACLTAFTILYCKEVKDNPFLIFDYYIRLGFVRNVLLGLEYYSSEDFYRQTGLSQQMSLKNNVGLAIAYCLGHDTQMASHIPLFALAGKNRKDKTKNQGRIDFEVESQANQGQGVVAYLPLSVLKYTDKNETRLYYSFYNLIAVLAEILRTPRNEHQNEAVKSLMMNLQLLRTYPTWSREGDIQTKYVDEPSYESTQGEEINVKKKDDDTSLDELTTAMVNWSKEYHESVPPYLIGRIATRLYYTLQKIRETNLGEQMHRSVTAFWNACLIEEATEYYTKGQGGESIEKLNLSNVITHERYFFDNMSFIIRNKAEDSIKLTMWMIRCPLLWAFTNDEILKPTGFEKIVSTERTDTIFPFDNRLNKAYNVYKILKAIRVKDAPLMDFTAAKGKIEKTIEALNRIEYDINSILDKENDPAEIAEDLNEIQIFRNRVTKKMVKDFRTNYTKNESTTYTFSEKATEAASPATSEKGTTEGEVKSEAEVITQVEEPAPKKEAQRKVKK